MKIKRTHYTNERLGLRLANPESMGTTERPRWELVWIRIDEGPDESQPPIPTPLATKPGGAPGGWLIEEHGTRKKPQGLRRRRLNVNNAYAGRV